MPRSGDTRRRPSRRPAQRPPARRVRWARVAVPVAVLCLVGFLYWHPLARYVETRNELARRQQDVAELRAEKAVLEHNLEKTTNLVVLAREARHTGLVRPGEQLFIVKGIPAWRRARAER